MKLLLAEDTADLNRAIVAILEMQNFHVDSALDGEQALEFLENNGYDGIILDIMMPKKNGLEVLEEIRAKNIITPVLMLTAKAEVEDRVLGLDSGADDYLTKPFAMKELVARVRAMVRRNHEYNVQDIEFGDLVLCHDSLELTARNTVRLSIKEFELMQMFLLSTEKPLSSDYLLSHVWRGDAQANEDMLKLYVNYLRGKLGYVNSKVEIAEEEDGCFLIKAGNGNE